MASTLSPDQVSVEMKRTEVAAILKQLVATRGIDLCRERARLEGLLRDLCPTRRQEVSALVQAVQAGVATGLAGRAATEADLLMIRRLVFQLHAEQGTAVELAAWAVSTWATALDVAHDADSALDGAWAIPASSNRSGRPISPRVDELMRDAESAVRAGGHQRALELPGEALAIDAGDMNARRLRADAQRLDLADEGAHADMSGCIQIPSGRFLMGSPAGDAQAWQDETPQHQVMITRAFELQAAPVTTTQYATLLGTQSSWCGRPSHPAVMVSWFDALRYCNALSRQHGLEQPYKFRGLEVRWRGLTCNGYRLPTEAEWEYACRAGAAHADDGDLDTQAWWSANSDGACHPIRSRAPNAWGLYDMLGNVWEWVWDRYGRYPAVSVADPTGPAEGPYRVARGGCWQNDAPFLRATKRALSRPSGRSHSVGFRIARTLP